MVTLKIPTICLVFFCLSFSGFSQQQAYESPAGTKFLLYTPPGYFSGSSTYPLLLSLHSKGEVGDDLTELTSNNPEQMPSRLIYLNRWPQDLPFIVLTPQLKPDPTDPDGAQWPAGYIDEVVNYVTANYRVDLNRIYVTGISRGGTGTWTYAATYPHKVAAILPIAGRTDLTQACRLKNIPIWTFNGDGDLVVVPEYSMEMVKEINACQPAGIYEPRINIINARDHNGWNELYNGSSEYKIYEWLLMFRKNDTSNKKPYVNAGSDLRIHLRSVPLHIIGDFFDSDGSITNVAWTQTGGVPLTLNDTGSGMLKISDLQKGLFEFQLLVTDNRGATNIDKVFLEIADTTVTPAITQLVLFNGKTNAAIGTLSDGQQIDMAALGLTEININALATSGTASVKFSVNSEQNTRSQNAGPYFIKKQTNSSEWNVRNGIYLICATAYPKVYSGGNPGVSQCVKVTVKNRASELCPGTGKIHQEFWTGLAGADISSIPVQSQASFVNDLTHFEGPSTNISDNYGSRIRGYVCPPTSGIYSFWISADDRAELWLSSNDDPAGKVKIAFTEAATRRRQWTKFPGQKSAGIRLIANQKYYIEALHKEATGADHVSVGWESPAGALERPIPRFRLIPFERAESPAVGITNPEDGEIFSNPAVINITANATASEGNITMVEFYNGSAKLGEDASPPYSFGWTDVPSGSYKLEVKAIATNGATATASLHVSVTSMGGCAGTGTITRDLWTGVPGSAVSLIPVSEPPTLTEELTIFEIPAHTEDNYATRIRGSICPPISGDYIFWISGDDHAELWLSTDDTAENKIRIAWENGWTGVRQWTKYASQQSAPVPLTAHQMYYIEALHKEATGGDHVSVGWQLPDGVLERPIRGSRLSPLPTETAPTFGFANGETDYALITDEGDNMGLHVFPNPAHHGVSELRISGYEGVTDKRETQIFIRHLMGEVIYADNIQCESDCDGYAFMVEKDIPPGFYLVDVTTNGKRITRRLVIR